MSRKWDFLLDSGAEDAHDPDMADAGSQVGPRSPFGVIPESDVEVEDVGLVPPTPQETAASPAAEPAGEPPSAPEQKPSAKPDEDDTVDEADLAKDDEPGIVFAGKRFKDQAAAERAYRAQIGRTRGAVKREQEARQSSERVLEAVESLKTIAARSVPAPQAAPEPPAPPARKRLQDRLDLEEHRRLLVQEGPEAAAAYQAQITQEYLDEMLGEQLEPVRQMQEKQREFSEATDLWNAACSHQVGGVPTFPELQNEATRKEVIDIWRDEFLYKRHPLVFDPDHAGELVALAITYHRNLHPTGSQPSAQPQPAPAPPRSALTQAMAASRTAASSLSTLGSGSARARDERESEEARIAREHQSTRHPVFGVRVDS